MSLSDMAGSRAKGLVWRLPATRGLGSPKTKRIIARFFRIGLFSLLLCGPGGIANASDAGDQVRQQTEGLRAVLRRTADLEDHRDQMLRSLDVVDQAMKNGATYFALYRLQTLWARIYPYEYLASKPAIGKRDIAALDKEWRAMLPRLRAAEEEVGRGCTPSLPLAIRGLIQISRTRSAQYFEASRPYGHETEPRDGLYYIGVAQAEIKYASFLERLKFIDEAAGKDIPGISAQLDQLDGEIVDTYKKRDSPKLVEEFIALNSNMELARQLEKADRTDGVLIAYLETSLKLGLLQDSEHSSAPAELMSKLDQFEERLRSGGTDNSIGQIFCAAARQALFSKEPPNDLTIASVLIQRVLPKYFTLISELQK